MTIFNNPIPYSLSGDFQKDEELIRGEIEKMPVLRYYQGWLYLSFKQMESNYPKFFKEEKGTGFKDGTLVFSEERKRFVADGMFWNGIHLSSENLIGTLHKFHLQYETSNRVSLGRFYSYCYYYLAGKIKSNGLKNYQVELQGLLINKLRSQLRSDIDKLNQCLLSLLNNIRLNHEDYWEELSEEYKDELEGDLVRTYSLIDREKFEYNLDRIYSKLSARYIKPSTETEHLEQLFSGTDEYMIPITWVSSANHLNYFLRHLRRKNKISNGNYFKIAKSLFIDINGNPFHNLKNNHSQPSYVLELEEIIKLF